MIVLVKPTGDIPNSEDKFDLTTFSSLKSEQSNQSPVVVTTATVSLAHVHDKLSLNKLLRSAVDKDTVIKRAS